MELVLEIISCNFVISQKWSILSVRTIFQAKFKIDNALYLDGSISFIFIPKLKRHDKTFNLGPIVAEIAQEN